MKLKIAGLLVTFVAGMALAAYLSAKFADGPARFVHVDPVPRPYLIERTELKPKERVVIKECVPIEVVEKATDPTHSEKKWLKNDPDAITGQSKGNNSESQMFPLYLGDLEIGPAPYGGTLEARLEEGESGAGKLAGTFTPHPKPKWELLLKERWVEGAIGMGAVHGLMGELEVYQGIVRYRRVEVGTRLEAVAAAKGSDVRWLVTGRVRF